MNNRDTLKFYPEFPAFYEVRHPLLAHKISLLRDKHTSTKEFREFVNEVSVMLAYEATRDLQLTPKTIETPLETFEGSVCIGQDVVVVPILRAGIGMLEGFLELIPNALIGSIGLVREKNKPEPNCYQFNIPEASQEKNFFICDPMLATGNSAHQAIVRLKDAGVRKITLISIIAAPEGVKKLLEAHQDIEIYVGKLDRELNSHGYILPGLGDAGDRLFGTIKS